MSHIQKLQAAMLEKSVEAVIISSELNQRYLSGFAYTDGYMLILKDTAYLITDFRYIEAAKATVNAAECHAVMPTPNTPMLPFILSLLKEHGVSTLTFEEDEVSVALRDRLASAFEGVTLTTGASAMLTQLRIFKDESEINAIRRAQKITDDAFTYILSYITPDRTELDVALELEFFMRARGSEGTAFETIAVSGTNSSRPHGVPRPVKLERGFLTMDFGARVDGYCADMTRTIVLGKADEDIKRLYHTVLRAQATALEGLTAGMKCKDADKLARDVIDGAGYKGCFGHSLGHGVGLFVHEKPNFSPASPEDMILLPGHVVTVEPGIYVEGKYGCRIEDMIYVHPDGKVEDLTHSPKELIEL